MKLEFLGEGSPECPLIRLYEFTEEEACHLCGIFDSLAGGLVKTVALHDEPIIDTVNGCRFTLSVDDHDRGVQGKGPYTFECQLTRLTWDNIGGLVSPFCKTETKGYQWLTKNGRISLLISCDGKW